MPVDRCEQDTVGSAAPLELPTLQASPAESAMEATKSLAWIVTRAVIFRLDGAGQSVRAHRGGPAWPVAVQVSGCPMVIVPPGSTPMVSDWHPDDRATLAYEQLLAIAQAIAPVTGGVPPPGL